LNGYYALLKRRGKQFRRSLKTKDRKLADRRLNDLRSKIGCLKISQDAKLNFKQAAKLWLETNRHATSSGTVKRREMYIKGLVPYFKNLPVRNITEQNCDRCGFWHHPRSIRRPIWHDQGANDAFKTAPLSSGRIIKSDDGREWLHDVKLKSSLYF
jgi:hypothetical protein